MTLRQVLVFEKRIRDTEFMSEDTRYRLGLAWPKPKKVETKKVAPRPKAAAKRG